MGDPGPEMGGRSGLLQDFQIPADFLPELLQLHDPGPGWRDTEPSPDLSQWAAPHTGEQMKKCCDVTTDLHQIHHLRLVDGPGPLSTKSVLFQDEIPGQS